MSLLGRLRTGPRLFAAFLLVFALSAVATVVGLVGLSRQHSAAVEADHLRVLVEEMDKANYYTSDIGAWEMGVGMDAFYLGPQKAVASDGPNRSGLLADVDATKVSTKMVTEVQQRAAQTAADAASSAGTYRTATLAVLAAALVAALLLARV